MNKLRLKLQLPMDEFIGTKYEEQIISNLYDLNQSIPSTLTIKFWYDKNKKIVTPDVVKRFIIQWESKLPYKTEVKPYIVNNSNDFVWFNIIHRSDYSNILWSRFDYVYDTHSPVSVLRGVEAFRNTALFCLRDKPEKQRAKRSDF